jgi:phosphoglycerol transferase MdoB-like AlkP superfamily enzyme
VLAVQCESFIDPARIFRHAPDLPSFRAAKHDAAAQGPLDVPCGGAYTMRTEFSFLTGISPEALGCDRFNPYARAERREYPSLAKTLKAAGYETDFVHPHDLHFFRRDAVMPALGFDRLHGADEFRTAPRCGPHVSDAAVAGYLGQLLEESNEPRFVFAVTMENHGPWFPGRFPGCSSARDAYLQHLVNSDRMLGMLTGLASCLDRPLVLCWYGDHSPILNYDIAHERPPHTDYLITSTEPSRSSAPQPSTLCAHELPSVLLSLIGDISRSQDTPWNLTPCETNSR